MDRPSTLSWAEARPFDHDPRAAWLPSASASASARPEWPSDFSWPEAPLAADELLYARPVAFAPRPGGFPLIPDGFSMGMTSAVMGMARPQLVHGNPRAREIAIGRWTNDEHRWFLKGLEMFQGPAWGEIARLIGSRTSTQVRTHAQKFFTKLARQGRSMPHFDAQIRKERERLLAQGVHVQGAPSAPSATRPPSLLSRGSFGADADALGYTLATPTSAAPAFGLAPLNSMSPTTAKLSSLAKKRPLSPSAELDAALADYAPSFGVAKPRLAVDTSASTATAAFPQLPSPPAWIGPLPSPIPLPSGSSAAALDDSLPPMTRLLRRS